LATVLVENGLKHEQVMKITGHKKLLTLQRYVKSRTDIDQMLEIGMKIRNDYKQPACYTFCYTHKKTP